MISICHTKVILNKYNAWLTNEKCRSKSIETLQVVHDCHARAADADALKRVQDQCQDKEACEIKPAPSFFGHRRCDGAKKTWFFWNCYNHESEYYQFGEEVKD